MQVAVPGLIADPAQLPRDRVEGLAVLRRADAALKNGQRPRDLIVGIPIDAQLLFHTIRLLRRRRYACAAEADAERDLPRLRRGLGDSPPALAVAQDADAPWIDIGARLCGLDGCQHLGCAFAHVLIAPVAGRVLSVRLGRVGDAWLVVPEHGDAVTKQVRVKRYEEAMVGSVGWPRAVDQHHG